MKKCPNCGNEDGIKVRVMECVAHYVCPRCSLICSKLDSWRGGARFKPSLMEPKREALVLSGTPKEKVRGRHRS